MGYFFDSPLAGNVGCMRLPSRWHHDLRVDDGDGSSFFQWVALSMSAVSAGPAPELRCDEDDGKGCKVKREENSTHSGLIQGLLEQPNAVQTL